MAFRRSSSYSELMEKSGFRPADLEQSAYALSDLKKILLHMMPGSGVFATQIPDVGMARRDKAGISEHRFDRPIVSLLVQGSKETVIGSHSHRLISPQVLTVCVDMPSSSRILEASPDNPLLTLFFYINPRMINELLLELGSGWEPRQQANGVFVTTPDAVFLEAMLHLAKVIEGRKHLALRARLALMDLHILLLAGAQGALLKEVYATSRQRGNELCNAIRYLKENLNRGVSAAELAKAANMSESSLYRHFKTLTGLSPLQYHKQLRLHKARELIMAEHEQASRAAYRVGFESVSQFSREYKKLFGIPPKQIRSSLHTGRDSKTSCNPEKENE